MLSLFLNEITFDEASSQLNNFSNLNDEASAKFFLGTYKILEGEEFEAIEFFKETLLIDNPRSYAYSAARSELKRLGFILN